MYLQNICLVCLRIKKSNFLLIYCLVQGASLRQTISTLLLGSSYYNKAILGTMGYRPTMLPMRHFDIDNISMVQHIITGQE